MADDAASGPPLPFNFKKAAHSEMYNKFGYSSTAKAIDWRKPAALLLLCPAACLLALMKCLP